MVSVSESGIPSSVSTGKKSVGEEGGSVGWNGVVCLFVPDEI